MINLVTLLIAAALVSVQCSYKADAQIANAKMDLDNNLQANTIHTKRKRINNYVRIDVAPPQQVRYEPGTRMELICEVQSSPVPTVQWLKNGEPVDYEEEANEIPTHYPLSFAHYISKLIVTSANDGDVFTCLATAGRKETSASTTVYSEGEVTPKLLTLGKFFTGTSKPIITAYYKDILQEYNTMLILPCRVQSSVDHDIFWRDNNYNIVYSNPRIQVLPSGDLLFADLKWDDMGNWTCTAQNKYGKDSVSTFLYPLKPRKQ